MGNHLSRTGITSQSQAALKSRSLEWSLNLLSLAPDWGLPSQYLSILLVRSYRTFAPLPYFSVLGGMFLWHFPHGFPHWELPSKLDHMGARTFLKKVLFRFQNKTFSRLPPLLSFSIKLIIKKNI